MRLRATTPITVRILCANATSAFFFPSRFTHRRYAAANAVPLVWLAAHAACTSAVRSHWLPLVVRPLRRLPALWSFPGHIPAHDAR